MSCWKAYTNNPSANPMLARKPCMVIIVPVNIPWILMMTSSNGNIFHVTGPLCGEFTGVDVFFDRPNNGWVWWSRDTRGWGFYLWNIERMRILSLKYRVQNHVKNIGLIQVWVPYPLLVQQYCLISLPSTENGSHEPLTRYVKLRVAHVPGIRDRSPATDFKGNRLLAIPICITARAWPTCTYMHSMVHNFIF